MGLVLAGIGYLLFLIIVCAFGYASTRHRPTENQNQRSR